MFYAKSIGIDPQSCKADFGDQARRIREQGFTIAEDVVKAVKSFYEHFPRKSTIHNGLEIECSGEIDDWHGTVTVTVKTCRVAGGMYGNQRDEQ